MNCTAGLKVSTTADGKFNVEACRMELQHIWLSKKEWQEIASKFQQGAPADKILDVIPQSMPNNLHRDHILESVLAWIEEWKSLPHKYQPFSQDARRGKCRPAIATRRFHDCCAKPSPKGNVTAIWFEGSLHSPTEQQATTLISQP